MNPIPKVPLLVIIPFWERDKPEAIELVKILNGLQDSHVGQEVHLLLVARQDCAESPEMVKIAAQKFNVYTFKSMSPLRGWPSGANGMFGAAMIYVANYMKDRYEALYWMEPDAVPVRKLWYRHLINAWRTRKPGVLVMGHRSDCNGDGTGDHITGCAIYHPNIARMMPKLMTCDAGAWDYIFRNDICAVGQHLDMIENRYKQTNLPHSVIDHPNTVIIHGVKCNSITQAVRKKFGIL